MKDVTSAAQEKLDEVVGISETAGRRIQAGQAFPTIDEFFPELQNAAYGCRTNIPREISVPQFALLGQQGVFDLEPMSPERFREEHRVDIDTAFQLVKRRILIPNLYVRDVSEWKGADSMYDLVAASLANGARVDAFMSLKCPEYDDIVDRHMTQLSETFRDLSETQRNEIARISRVRPHTKLEAVTAKRWAYLDALHKPSADQADDFRRQGLVRDMVCYVRAAKHCYASEITAAIGGRFVWGQEDTLLKEEYEPDEGDAERIDLTEELEYLLTKIAGIQPFAHLHAVDGKKLLDFLDANDNTAVRDQVLQMSDDLVALAEARQLTEANVMDYQQIVEDYRKRLGGFQLASSVVTQGAAGAAGAGIGFCFAGVFGAMFGGAIAAWVTNAENASPRVGRAAFRLLKANRRADRLMATLDKVSQ